METPGIHEDVSARFKIRANSLIYHHRSKLGPQRVVSAALSKTPLPAEEEEEEQEDRWLAEDKVTNTVGCPLAAELFNSPHM